MKKADVNCWVLLGLTAFAGCSTQSVPAEPDAAAEAARIRAKFDETGAAFEAELEATTDPPAEATFQYGWRGHHSWIGHSPIEPERQMTYAEFIQVLAGYMQKR